MATREQINRVSIEAWRVSRVPCDPDETIYQGDLLVWDAVNSRATKATAASAGTFIGMSETTNPVETAGSTRFLSDTKLGRLNVVQAGLVEVIAGEVMTIKPFEIVTVGSNAQTVVKSGANSGNQVGFIDPAYGAAGKQVQSGDLIKIWLTVPAAYKTV